MEIGRKASLKKYNTSEKNKLNQARYRKTEGWRLSQLRYRKTRKNNLAKKRWQTKMMKDPLYRMNRSISNGVWCSMKRNKDEESWSAIVGYSLEELKNHLEGMFDKNMFVSISNNLEGKSFCIT